MIERHGKLSIDRAEMLRQIGCWPEQSGLINQRSEAEREFDSIELRPLSEQEVEALEAHGNSSSDWSLIRVADPFDSTRIVGCRFEGCVEIAAPFFYNSRDGNKIRLHLGPALETLKRLEGSFDMAFIDADKTGYLAYYEECLRLLRPGGVILVDNALWSGRVLDPGDSASASIDALNRHIETDERVDRVLLTVRDGMFLVRKR